jgi:POT family proton-dependent oligopeptide transporter
MIYIIGLNNTIPFLVALVADFMIGDYWMMMILLIVFFLPGILVITLCAWPYQLGDTFPMHLYRVGFQILFTIGNGGIDTIVDIFGAKQFHPVIHTHLLDSYFVWSTVMAGVGGVTAELVYAMIANVNVTVSFGLMTIALFISTLLFVYGTKRYIVRKNDMKDCVLTAWAMLSAALCWKRTAQGQVVACPPGFNKVKKSRGGGVRDELVTAARRFALVVPVQGLFVPVNFALFQMTNLLIPMSYSMKHPKLWTGANMVFVHSGTIVIFGTIANKFLFPFLEKRNIHLSTAHRVSIGSCLQAFMYFVMLGVDHRIRKVYEETGEMISIGWQFFPYTIGAIGWVFVMPPQDAITFRVAPSEWKVLGNAVNKFMQGGLSSFVARALYKRTEAWFLPSNGNTNINGIENYTSATSYKFLWVCFGFALFQAVFCALPWVNSWYIKIEKYCEARSAE